MDLCLTDNTDIVYDVIVTPTLVSHNIIEVPMCGPKVVRDIRPEGNIQNLSDLNFRRADWKSIQKQILLHVGMKL